MNEDVKSMQIRTDFAYVKLAHLMYRLYLLLGRWQYPSPTPLDAPGWSIHELDFSLVVPRGRHDEHPVTRSYG